MDNIPPNTFSNMPLGVPMNVNQGHSVLNQGQQLNHVPLGQLPPGYGPKQDNNSNSPLNMTTPQNHALGPMQSLNNYNQSGNSSPAFNHSGMLPTQPQSLQSSPMRPQIKAVTSVPNQPGGMQFNNPIMVQNPAPVPPSSAPNSSGVPFHNQLPNQLTTTLEPVSTQNQPGVMQFPNPSLIPKPLNSASPLTNNSPIPYNPNFPPQPIINNNTPPLIPSSHQNQYPAKPPVSDPPGLLSQPSNQYPNNAVSANRPPTSMPGVFSQGQQPFQPGPPLPTQPRQIPPTSMQQPNLPFNGPVPTSMGPPRPMVMNGPVNSYAAPSMGPPISNAVPTGPPKGPMTSAPGSMSGPIGYQINRPPTGPPMPGQLPTGLSNGPGGQHMNQLRPMGPPLLPTSQPLGPQAQQGPIGLPSGPTRLPAPGSMGPPIGPMGPPSGPMGPIAGAMGPPPGSISPPQSLPAGLPSGPQSLPLMGQQTGPPKGNMQNRYPQTPASNYGQPVMQQPGRQYPQQYNAQNLTQQMGQMSVTKQGFDQLWGHQMIDLMQCRQILPEYPEEPPEIRLPQFPESPNCSSEIFRCTVNKIPDTNSLLQKSRLPLGILIHPFKDLNYLPVIQCNTIVRCRACRTYINPFAYFVDNKRWKCNLCYRVNDLPEEFQYDPVSKSYGDPSRRPEIKSATIEYIAPGEYMLRPPQPAVYLFLMDVSQIGRDSGYLKVLCETLQECLDKLPGDARTQVGFICYDAHVHYYLMNENLTRPKEVTVIDIDDVFLPSPESLLVNLREMRGAVNELISALAERHAAPAPPACALGAALQAAFKLMAPTGGRVTVFQTCLPNVGPGALQSREDPNARSSKEVNHLNPATDFYKRLALDCSGAQVAIDLFLISSQYSDLASLSGMSKFSGGSIYHIPLFNAARPRQAEQFRRMLTRYLTRKIGFEAVMRVRCTRGISIHTFHGNFFVRSTDLLSLPNVSPDLGFGMQLSIDESLTDLQHVCFQAALLYTTSKGERRIRVHTLALPIATTLSDVLHSADQQCIIGLLAKMAVDRCMSASLSEAREALLTVAVDTLSAHRLAQNLPPAQLQPALLAPASLRLLPLYLLALLKRKAFRTGTSTRLDERVGDMCALKAAPLCALLRGVYPALYALHALHAHAAALDAPDPPRLHLTAERINQNGAYLLDDGEMMIIYVCHGVSPAFLSEVFGVTSFNQLSDEMRELPELETDGNELLHAFIDKLNDDRPYAANIMVLRDNSPNRTLFTERLVDDRVESSFSYYEFLQHVKTQVK